jgi:hypothetical protein
MKDDVHPALVALRAVAKKYPEAWKLADLLRFDEPRNWPDWCYLPVAGWAAIMTHQKPPSLLEISQVSHLAALGAWRVTQGIYRFDAELADALMSTPLGGDMPCDALYHLPEWCIYVETDIDAGGFYGAQRIKGFWVHLEYDSNTHGHELRFLLNTDTELVPLPLHLGPWSLETSIEKARQLMGSNLRLLGMGVEAMSNIPASHDAARVLAPLLSLVLYLCSEGAEIGGGSALPRRPAPIRKKGKLRMFPPDKPTAWPVGIRIGAAIRAGQKADSSGASDGLSGVRMRPHVRRAHWHGYRYGAKLNPDGSLIPVASLPYKLQWLPPIAVNVDDPDALPAVIHAVKGVDQPEGT